jgi:pyruvate/2-oxoglutarate dehydrogenase complex dihydrolipoamide acyltransferase (E2) component
VNAPYHHLYEWGTVSLFVAMGKYAEELSLDQDGKLVKKTLVEITFTVDERIADGFYLARALQTFKQLMEHPEELEKPVEEGMHNDT